MPLGCDIAKSCSVKPRASSTETARASPIARVAVVLAVGARFSGQASSGTLTSIATVEARPSVESTLPTSTISGTARRFRCGSRSTSSGVSPELEIATTTSVRVIIPRSPWPASAGCRKNAGVPVLAKVAAIFRAICPDLPIPVTTTRPSHAEADTAGSGKPRIQARRKYRNGLCFDFEGSAPVGQQLRIVWRECRNGDRRLHSLRIIAPRVTARLRPTHGVSDPGYSGKRAGHEP